MAGWLPAAGIDYVWEPRLGGRRRLPKEPAADLDADAWWRVEAFRAYAAHTRTEEFAQGLRAVLSVPPPAPLPATLFMCSESVWWRCHRRLLADHLVLVRQVEVVHLMHDGRLTLHPPTSEARLDGDRVVYDVGANLTLDDM